MPAKRFDKLELPRGWLTLTAGARRFLRAWLAELGAMLPGHAGGVAARAALLELAPDGVILRRMENGKPVEAGRIPLPAEDETGKTVLAQAIARAKLDGARTILCLPPGQYLAKRIGMPAAAEENLRQVLGYEMDRHTPFKADEASYGFRVTARDTAAKRLEIRLVAAPRARVESALSRLAAWGVRPFMVSTIEDLGAGATLNLLEPERQPRRHGAMPGRTAWALGAVLAVTALTALAFPILVKREAVVGLLPIVAKARLAAAETDTLRASLDAMVSDHDHLLKKKQATPAVVELLDELSHILPDDTWVSVVEMRGTELQLQGETGSSSKLVEILAQSPMLADTSFRSPLTKLPQGNAERFHVAATVKVLPEAGRAARQGAGTPVQPVPAAVPVSVPAQPPKAPATPPQPAAPSTAAPVAPPQPPVPPAVAPQSATQAAPAPQQARPATPPVAAPVTAPAAKGWGQ